MFTKILLASDGSEDALKAAQAVAELAQKFASSVTILHVFTMPQPIAPLGGVGGVELDIVALERYAEEVQDAVARRTGRVLEEAGVTYDSRLELGHAADVILRVAEEEKFDLIALGSRGLSGLQSFLLGSVSDRVTHHAHCPVLIVK